MKTNLKSLVVSCIHALLVVSPKVTAVLVRLMMVVLIVSSLHLAGCKSDKKLAPAKMGSVTSQELKKASNSSIELAIRDEKGGLMGGATVRLVCRTKFYDQPFTTIAGQKLVIPNLEPCMYYAEVTRSGYLTVTNSIEIKPYILSPATFALQPVGIKICGDGDPGDLVRVKDAVLCKGSGKAFKLEYLRAYGTDCNKEIIPQKQLTLELTGKSVKLIGDKIVPAGPDGATVVKWCRGPKCSKFVLLVPPPNTSCHD